MRLHVVGLPHTQTTKAYSNCAYTTKVRRFVPMMQSLGYDVTLYASELTDTEGELVTCITRDEQAALIDVHGPQDVLKLPFEPEHPAWDVFNMRAAVKIAERAEPHDVVCLIAGRCQARIAAANPELLSVEFGVGYSGVFSAFKAFESYAWMHLVYGLGGDWNARGSFYDRVIPNYFDPDEYEFRADKDGYLAYVGRLNEDKGVQIAAQVAAVTGRELVVAGQGPIIPEGCDYRGLVGPEERSKILAGASAVLVPSLYLEPFGGVAVEAMLSGTPAITTDWGAFPETVAHGVSGFRCRTLKDFVSAVAAADHLNPYDVEEHAMRYSTDQVRHTYDRWFTDLDGLWGPGWSDLS